MSHTFTLKEGVDVPRRHRLQRRGSLRQLRPLVQLDRSRRERGLSYYYGKLFRGYVETPDAACTSRCTPDGDTRSPSSSTSRSPASSRRCRCPPSRCSARRLSPSSTPTASAARRGARPSRSTAPGTRPAPARTSSTEWAPGEQLTLSAYEDYWGERVRSTRSSSASSMTRPHAARRSSPARSTATTSSAPPTPAPSRTPASRWSPRPVHDPLPRL